MTKCPPKNHQTTAQAMQLRAAFQYYADKGRLMTIRRADTEEITFLDENANPIATLRTEPMRYITDIWDTRDIGDDYVLTSLVCDHIPPIDQFEVVWGSFRGRRNVIVTDIKMHKGCVRDLSKEAPIRPDELLPYMHTEHGWTKEMIDEVLTDLEQGHT